MTLKEIIEKHPESLNSRVALKGYVSDYLTGESKGYCLTLNTIIDSGIFDAMKKAGCSYTAIDESRHYLILTEDYALSSGIAQRCLKDAEEALGIEVKSVLDIPKKDPENAKKEEGGINGENQEPPKKEKTFEEQRQEIMNLTKFQLWQRAIPLLPGETEEEYWKRVREYMRGLYTDAYNLAMNSKNKGDGKKQ